MESIRYAPAVDSLMYAMLATRPDIAHALGLMSRFMHNPKRLHWNVVKHVFRYLTGTKDHCILLNPNNTSSIVGYIDSNFTGYADSQKSTTGYYKFGNGAISWRSKLQECTDTSTTEAKYVATSDADKDSWLDRVMHMF